METELLAPAGSEQSAKIALYAGADAVYLGLKEFSAREGAENFDAEGLKRTADLAHLLGAKVYVCLNTLVKDSETARFFECARLAYNAGADGILLQDIFLGKALKRAYPELTLHLSTQAGCCNIYGAQLAKECGFSRVVLARETPLAEIRKISQIIQTEAFVQGALCTCFSGQCYLSSFAGNNSGNRGRCKQPCRKRYSFDRAGFEEAAYALSTSDLCVGARVKELVEAGVYSLKIEGRLRRGEYVAAAVKYYRALLGGGSGEGELSDLKRAYNRGDYTEGLAFGQKKGFLSRSVQGHVGERVGSIALVKGKYFCKSGYSAGKGDGFKILRAGVEVGGAAFTQTGEGGFFLSASAKLCAGDEVRLTTQANAGERLLAPAKEIPVRVHVRICAGEQPTVVCGTYRHVGGEIVEAAKNAPLSAEEICENFAKTEFFAPRITVETENAFLPKSALNGLRREFYAGLKEALLPRRTPLEARAFTAEVQPKAGTLTAVITADEEGAEADVVIYKPQDYRNVALPKRGKEKFLYLPPLFTTESEGLIAGAIGQFDGVYCEGYYGIKLAEKYKKPLFAGIGFNLTNRFAVEEIQEKAKYFALSMELATLEQNALAAAGAFTLCAGGVKVMELCYCPFGVTCKSCDRRAVYTLTDEEGRKFPLRRYDAGEGHCRFEVYNCAALYAKKGVSSLLADESVMPGALRNYQRETPPQGATKGHSTRSML